MISSHAPSLAHSFAEAQTPFCRTILSATQLRPAYRTVAPTQGAIMGFVLEHKPPSLSLGRCFRVESWSWGHTITPLLPIGLRLRFTNVLNDGMECDSLLVCMSHVIYIAFLLSLESYVGEEDMGSTVCVCMLSRCATPRDCQT
jgi:hypothetical protein